MTSQHFYADVIYWCSIKQHGKNMKKTRIEKDSMGDVEVPVDALYGAQTQRAVNNFPISGIAMPRAIIRSMGLLKAACAAANAQLDELDKDTSQAIAKSALTVANGQYDNEFPIDIFQTGSGTSTNMNANEVIATLATREMNHPVHPNDHVNKGQSSNDVIPTCIHIAATLQLSEKLLPALQHLGSVIDKRAEELKDVVTTGRTHLMDAMPVTFGQVLGGWSAQIKLAEAELYQGQKLASALVIGGTAVGTGINAHPEFDNQVCRELTRLSDIEFSPMGSKFMGLSTQDSMVQLSGKLRGLAVALMKIANDLRWLNSGPLAGFAEISLPALQPGSSIMPGKVNPVVPEAVCMVAAQVMGNDATIAVAGQSGSFQLNVMLPVIAYNITQSIEILSNSSVLLADKALADFTLNYDKIEQALSKNPILVTSLNNIIGYELGAKIAKTAYAENRAVLDVALEMTDLSKEELEKYLNPANLANPHTT